MPVKLSLNHFTSIRLAAIQLAVQQAGASGAELMTLSQSEIDRHLIDMAKSDWYGYEGELEWNACRRRLDAEMPHYTS